MFLSKLKANQLGLPFHIRLGPVGAFRQLRPPNAGRILVFDVPGLPRHVLFSGHAVRGLYRGLMRPERFGENIAQLVSPAAVMLYDFVMNPAHATNALATISGSLPITRK
jgi:hypothetical protein